MKTLTKLFVLLMMAGLTVVTAQQKDYSDEPGYIEFGDLEDFETGDRVTEVILEENILNMVSKLTKHEEQELSELISGLKLIKVHAFEVTDENRKELEKRIEAVNEKAVSKKWQRIVRVRDGEEIANVYIKTNANDDIEGLLVLSLERSGEAAFVNIVGDIKLETIGKLGGKFDIPSLDKVKHSDSLK